MNMKKYINTISAALLILCFASSCVDLNMNPPSEASSENWYKNADQITMSLNDLYRKAFYGKCLVVLQNNGEPGGVKVTATADGLEKATTAIKVK